MNENCYKMMEKSITEKLENRTKPTAFPDRPTQKTNLNGSARDLNLAPMKHMRKRRKLIIFLLSNSLL